MPGRLRAKRKPLDALDAGAPRAAAGDGRGCVLPPGSGKQVQILGDGAEAAPAVVEVLRELGLL